MSPWIAKAVVLAATVVMMAIRAPHGRRSRSVKVAKSYKTRLGTGVLVLAWVGFFVPLIWVTSPTVWFAEYPLHTGPLVAGVVCFVIGLWLFYRSHADLGTNWSITLEYARIIDLSREAFIAASATDVLGVGPVFRRARARHPQLGRRSIELDRLHDSFRASCSPRGKDDGRRVWQRIQCLRRTDEASGSWHLVKTRPANIEMEPTRSTVRAIMSAQRAAHFARSAVQIQAGGSVTCD